MDKPLLIIFYHDLPSNQKKKNIYSNHLLNLKEKKIKKIIIKERKKKQTDCIKSALHRFAAQREMPRWHSIHKNGFEMDHHL